MMPTEKRFFSYVFKNPDTKCWEWLNAANTQGYGRFYYGNFTEKAHRFSYELKYGKITDGLQIDHLCRNRMCVNPDHLESVTLNVNVMRGMGVCAQNARKNHCPYGHEYSKIKVESGKFRRICRICKDNHRKKWRKENPELYKLKSRIYYERKKQCQT